jgi:hypothetical protein
LNSKLLSSRVLLWSRMWATAVHILRTMAHTKPRKIDVGGGMQLLRVPKRYSRLITTIQINYLKINLIKGLGIATSQRPTEQGPPISSSAFVVCNLHKVSPLKFYRVSQKAPCKYRRRRVYSESCALTRVDTS